MKKKKIPKKAEEAKVKAAAMARATFGRKTKFIDRKKENNKKQCREKNNDDE